MIFLADLPPPVHGMANVNAKVLCLLRGKSQKVSVINTAPSFLARLFPGRLWQVAKCAQAIYGFLTLFFALLFCRENVVYRPINGGRGQLYDLAYLSLCSMFRAKVYIHHHSFQYLHSKLKIFSLLNIISPNSVHIVLGLSMRERLIDLYGINGNNIRVVSNAAFFDVKDDMCFKENQDGQSLKIGYLANITAAKGAFEVIELARKNYRNGAFLKVVMAGPVSEVHVTEALEKEVCCNSSLSYLGSLYGDRKSRFYQGIDVFVFPSKYINEAEPLVLYEAAQYGVLNIATDMGCMKDVLATLNGVCIQTEIASAESLSVALQRIVLSPSLLELCTSSNRQARLDLFHKHVAESKKNLHAVIKEILVK